MGNICFLIGNIDHSGGTERVTTIIANEFAQKKFQVHILSLCSNDTPFFEQHENIKNSSLFNTNISMRRHLLTVISRIRKYLIEHQIDTLIVVDSISCVFTVPACFGLKINHICWEHFNFKVNLGSRFRNLGRWMAAKWCSRIVTLTERDKIFWVEQYPNIKEKISVIANPSLFENLDHQPSLENRTVLAVGRLDYIKGFDLLLEAWALVCKKIDERWMLNIVGGGQEEANLKQLTQDLNIESRVIFSGQQKNVDPFYKNASIYCLSSRNEGFPMVLLEAQSYGLPIVAFDCDTGPAEVVVDGTGFLISPEDIEDYASQLLKLIDMNELEYGNMCTVAKENNRKFYLENIIEKWVTEIV
ncbi:glycosyltransferase family 4 protein [Acinetobacter amyesii]|uniref:glycosyltransferase family 4 protein n=1 Tax=Acinetobacter amyesii TaxID=2942470 RepID=UPI003F02EE54